MKVLIIDDDEYLLVRLAKMIRDRGHDVTEVESLSQAREVLSHDRFDHIICDGQLRDGDGYAFAKQLLDAGQSVVQYTLDPSSVRLGGKVREGVRAVGKSHTATVEDTNELLRI